MKKVNKEAIVNAAKRAGRSYLKSKCSQFESIFYVGPMSNWVSADDIIGLSVRLTGKIDRADVVTLEGNLALCLSVMDLLPEFIVDGEEWTKDEG